MDAVLPLDKLLLESKIEEGESDSNTKEKMHVVLVSTGSFNPPTFMHLRLFELARDALISKGFHVVGGYMSPVNDAYKKKGLLPAEHRISMCQLACKSSEFVMVDTWEAKQNSFQRSLIVLSRIKSFFCDSGLIPNASLKVMLVCGSDLLESFCIPGAWIPEQVRTIIRDYGVVCIRREGQDIEKIILNNEILTENKSNIEVVNEIVPNRISSTIVRFGSNNIFHPKVSNANLTLWGLIGNRSCSELVLLLRCKRVLRFDSTDFNDDDDDDDDDDDNPTYLIYKWNIVSSY